MANTTWSATDKTASVTLTGSNLIATSGGANQGVRAVDRQLTGKYYWETTCSSWTGSGTSVGVANIFAVLSSLQTNGTNGCIVFKSGAIFLNGAAASGAPTLGARVSGDIIGIALDLNAGLVWFRVAPSGNWNGNAGFAPGGTGGVNISSLGGAGVPIFPAASFSTSPDAITANFGGSAFSGAVPAGYTSGFPTPSPATPGLVTQSALEQFASTDPPAQVTQVTIEQWATTATVSGQAMVTQVALEQWVPAAKPPVELAGALTLSLALAGDLSSISVRYVDFTGNLGGFSSYGVLKYGKGHYSRVDFFAPFFAADLDVHVSLINLVGDLAPQIALEGALSILVPLDSLLGSFGFEVVYGASSFISGPLWAASEPCPVPPWIASEPCPPSLWTPIPPPTFAAPTGGWTKQEKTDGLSVWGGAAQ